MGKAVGKGSGQKAVGGRQKAVGRRQSAEGCVADLNSALVVPSLRNTKKTSRRLRV